MSSLQITDDDRRRYRESKERSLADLLPAAPAIAQDEPETEEADQEITPQLPTATYRQLAGAFAIIALFGLMAWIAFRPSTDNGQPTSGPAVAPAAQPSAAPAATATPAQIDAYAEPEGALLGPIDASALIAYRHSDFPEWGGVKWQGSVVWIEADHAPPTSLPDLARPTPAPATPQPKIIYIEPEPTPCDPTSAPPFVVEQEVYDSKRKPLGTVRGVSCISTADAQQNADKLAAELKGANP